MLSKKFYDGLTIVSFILIILLSVISIISFFKSGFVLIEIYWILIRIILVIYWVFALVLAIQLAAKKQTKIIDVIIVAIIVPLAIIFYLTNLRKSLKRVEEII